ncbi:MAG TPA: DUF362 domain-containing protein [Candidatus Dormibacteraeota bacterium]|nr:DUF362 domain-containing protein [Candidatus Dormibacteraeota bacterium]
MRSKVAVLRTSPERVVEDVGRLMELADAREELRPDATTLLKVNISWHVYYPGCSTSPWQLEGVLRHLQKSGFARERTLAAQNSTVVVDPHVGIRNNKLEPVLDRYGVRSIWLNDKESEADWIRYVPRGRMLVLNDVYPDGLMIPKTLMGTNVIHLPTLKTHVFTEMTGAMKNAFGGLLHLKRHWTHSVIHETLVDLLTIQKEIHRGIFAVMDGVIAGDGPGPRAMRPHVTNLLLASRDQVAIDATAAKLMGFDPLTIKFIRLANEAKLGNGDPRCIDLVGDDVSNVNLKFHRNENTFASKGQKLIYHGPLKPLEKILLRSPLVPWSYFASRLYHDGYWYPFVGVPRKKKIMESDWGKLFREYEPKGQS